MYDSDRNLLKDHFRKRDPTQQMGQGISFLGTGKISSKQVACNYMPINRCRAFKRNDVALADKTARECFILTN